MTAKEKAIELVEKFRMYDIQICDLMGSELKGYEEKHYKQCALICVDEIINTGINQDYKKEDGYMLSLVEYYTEVKYEINKL